jgi:hypothetical protein
MGNLLATLGTIGVPLFNHLVTIPFLYHPSRWGGIPWKSPNFIQLSIVTFILNVSLVLLLGTLGGIMSTKKECNKTDVPKTMWRNIWRLIGFLVGNAVLAVFVSLKGPLLVWLGWMPYASWLVHGIIVALPVLLLGAIGTNILIRDVCGPVVTAVAPVNAKTKVKKVKVKK